MCFGFGFFLWSKSTLTFKNKLTNEDIKVGHMWQKTKRKSLQVKHTYNKPHMTQGR